MDIAIPSTMRALLQPDANATALTLIRQPVPTATPNSTEHLILVHAAAFCNGELLWAKNFPPKNPSSKQLVPCYDVAGTVVTAPSSSPFHVGDEVYARTNYERAGCAREYTIALTEELAYRPQGLSWAESASVPLSALTAWQALFVHAGLNIDTGAGIGKQGERASKRVLVTGASGAVGMWVVQLARLVGAEVVATCGSDNVEFVKSLGATEVVDYKTTSLKEWAHMDENDKVDVVIDCVGKGSLKDAWWCVKDGGVLMSIYQPPEQMKPADWTGSDVKNLFFIMEPNGPQLQKITDLINRGKFQVNLDSVWALEEYEEAVKRLESGRTRGKVVLDMMVTAA
jgi:NADPH:quinone reductase-like Zn-dependent oxidoreductase